MTTFSVKRSLCVLALAMVGGGASAEVEVTCRLTEGVKLYESDYATLQIVSTQPIVVFEERYRSEDAVFNLPKGGTHTKDNIFSGLSSRGKYVIVTKDGSMQVVPFDCEPRLLKK